MSFLQIKLSVLKRIYYPSFIFPEKISAVFICLFFINACVFAQDSLPVSKVDTIYEFKAGMPILNSNHPISEAEKKKRIKLVAAAHAVTYAAGMTALYSAWYKDYPQSKFHFFNDSKEWKGMDKLGHSFTAYAVGKGSMELWRTTGINDKKAIWLGGLSGAAFQTIIETLDGFSTEWGWSWSDFAANAGGSALLIAQELAWKEQRVQIKVSFHKKRYADLQLQQRSNDLFGNSLPERLLKDYNGQTYWLSAGIKDFFPESKVPAWLQLAVGKGAEGMFGGYENIKKDNQGNIVFDRTDIKRYRQWYLAPDIDLTKIKTNKKSVKIILHVLSFIKFPTPALELSKGKFKMNWLAL